MRSAWLAPLLLATACATEAPGPVDEQGGSTPPVTEPGDSTIAGSGGAVLDVRAEATAVAHHLAYGTLTLASARSSFVGRLTAYDFDGAPSFYLVFTSPNGDVSNPLAFAVRQGPALLEASTGTAALIGADESRPEVAIAESGLQMLFDIEETLIAMGGAEHFDKLIVPVPGVLLLLDKTGVYWDASNRTMLSAEALDERKSALAQVRAEANDAEATARAEWEHRRKGDSAPSVELASLKTGRGNLDLSRAIDALLGGRGDDDVRAPVRSAAEEELRDQHSQRNNLWNNSTENCKTWWFFGWHSTCDAVEIGEISDAAKNQAHTPYQGRGRTVKWCDPRKSEPDTNASMGCGPAAFNALVWQEWKNGASFTALDGLDRAKAGSFDKIDAFYKELSTRLAVDVPREMGTCSFGEDGSATIPSGLKNGANRWLAANGSSKRMALIGGIAGGANVFTLETMARTLHDRVGVRGRATIAGFDTNFASSHWSPVNRYRIVRPAGLGALQVYVESLDLKGRWYSLGGIKLLSALAWLE